METKYELKKPERSIKMGCGSEISKWDDNAVQDSLAGKNTGFDPKMLAEMMPEVREAHNARSLELLGENLDNAKERIEEQVAQKGKEITDLDKIAREVWPTDQQLHEMVAIGEKLGISDTEIISVPLICATSGVKGAGELIYDMLWAIEHQDKIPYQHKDDTVFSKVVFVDARPMGKTGTKDADFDPVSKVLFIYKGIDGKFPSKEFIKDEILPHEIPHASEKFKEKLGDYTEELKFVMRDEQECAQDKGNVDISPYIEQLHVLHASGEIDGTTLALEWVSECVRLCAKGECLKTTREFLKMLFE